MKVILYSFVLLTFIFNSFIYSQRFSTENDSLRNGKKSQAAENNNTGNKPSLEYVPGEVIVKYRPTLTKQGITGIELLAEYEQIKKAIEFSTELEIFYYKPVFSKITDKMFSYNITENEVKKEILAEAGGRNKLNVKSNPLIQNEFARTVTIRFNNSSGDPLQIASKLVNNSELKNSGFIIEYAEPNYVYYTNSTVNDPLYEQQWALKKAKASEGWDIETGNKEIKIGIIDTGIDYLHEDLTGNYVAALSYDFVDVDTSSYASQYFYTIPGEDYTESDPDPKDYNGHGTHCAGIIGASSNNGKGVSGVAHNCSLVALRAGFSMINGTSEYGLLENDDISSAILHAVASGVDILSMSFRGSEAYTVKIAIKTAYESGIVLVAAAGNDNSSTVYYPAGYDNVISVAATDVFDAKASYSNYGYWVDIAAPGDYIYSTVPKKGGAICDITGYLKLSGTSMAAPFVAGLAALILSQHGSFSPSQVEYTLLKSVDTPLEVTNYIGRGRINLLKALQLNLEKSMDVAAIVSSPKEFEIISQNIDIIGSASGTGYTLSIGKGVYPQKWTEIGSGTTISNGTLCVLNKSDYFDGKYTIKLAASTFDAENEYRLPIIIGSFDNIHPGFPIELKPFFLKVEYTTEDIDGDNKKEIIGLSNPGGDADFGNYCDLFVYNSDGALLKDFPARLPFSAFPRQKPIVADIDNDGRKDIILFTCKSLPGFNNELGYITVYSSDAKIKPGFPVIISGGAESNYSAVSDIDLDGFPDIVAATSKGLYAVNYKGELLNGWPVLFNENFIARSPVVITNLDDDPQIEVLCTSFNALPPFEGPHYINAYNYDGTPVQGFPVNQKEAWGWTLSAGDLDQNGQMEIISQKYRISNNGQVLSWNTNNMESFSDFAIGNLNIDSGLEVVWGNYTGKAHVTDFEGKSLPGWPIQETGYLADGTHLIADVAGDEKPEIIIGWVSYQNEKTGVFAYNADGTTAPGFPLFNEVMNFSDIEVDDIDNDGLSELIGNNGQQILVLDLEKQYNPKNIEWGTARNNVWETGAYPVMNNNCLYDFRSLTITEDDTFFVRISPSYIHWDKYEVSAISSTNLINVSFNDGLVKIVPVANWSGEGSISVSISYNENLIDTTSLFIKVEPKNDAPVISKPLPDLTISEEDYGVVILPDLSEYVIDTDDNDHITFYASPSGTGLDSLVIGNFANLNDAPPFTGLHSVKRIKKNAVMGIKDGQEQLNKISSENFGLGKISTLNQISSEGDSTAISLLVYPKENFAGSINVIVRFVDDSSAEVSDTLNLTIQNINDKPNIFSLVSPINESILIINSASDSIKFSWNKSEDADQDTVLYTFVLTDSTNELSVNSIKDTIVSLNYAKLKSWFENGQIVAEWNVIAYDKYDTTYTAISPFSIVILDQTTGVEGSLIPTEFALFQNYPNPFNPVTTIKYALNKPTYVRLTVYDILGQVVKYLVHEYQDAGVYSIKWNSTDKSSSVVGSGIYFYKIETEENTLFKKMILLK